MSKITLHETHGMIVKITDNRYKNLSWKEGNNTKDKFYGDVSVHLITPAIDDDEQHYVPAQETYLYGQSARDLRDILIAALAEPSSSETDPHAKP